MEDAAWAARIGARIRELRNLKGWSLTKLALRTGDRLGKSRISNYEQGTRMPGPEEATILATAMGESPAHIMCLEGDMPALSKLEADLIRNFRALPENDRKQYVDRIALLAAAYKVPIPNDRLLETGFNPAHRPKSKPKAKARRMSKHEN